MKSWWANARRRAARLPRAADLRRFGSELVGAQRLTAARALGDAVVVTMSLKRHGLKPLLAETRRSPVVDPELARRISATVDASFGMLPMEPTCLRRSVTLKRELSRLGLASTMHIGVRIVDQKVEAHAWLQVGSEVINDQAETIATYSEIAVAEIDALMPSLA